MKSAAEFDPFAPEVIENPQQFFETLRAEATIYLMPNRAYYLVSRYEDIKTVALDTDTYSSKLMDVLRSGQNGQPKLLSGDDGGPMPSDVLAIADPPEHTRHRQVSNSTFTHRRVLAMKAEIQTLTDSLIEQWITEGKTDWISELAVPLPMTIIIKLLGLPMADMDKLKQWSDASVSLLSGVNTEKDMLEYNQDVADLHSYLDHHLTIASDGPGNNVIGDLIRESRINQDFGHDEMASILVQMLTAGNETTTSLIGSALMLVLKNPELQSRLENNPDDIDDFIEEALRLESPFHGHYRVVKKATRLAGVALKKGDRLMLLWSSANRDRQQFEDPTEIRLDRKQLKSHLAFGYGIHTCIGAALARMEASIALKTILKKTRNLRLSPENTFRHVPSLSVRSLESLLIEFDAV